MIMKSIIKYYVMVMEPNRKKQPCPFNLIG